MENQLGLNFGGIIKNVAVEMYGHNVGDVISGTVTGAGNVYEEAKPLVVLEKKPIIGGFAYLVAKKDKPEFVAIAQSMNKPEIADVLVYNARIIGSTNPEYAVKDLAQARAEFGF